jgi:hypothetical protein
MHDEVLADAYSAFNPTRSQGSSAGKKDEGVTDVLILSQRQSEGMIKQHTEDREKQFVLVVKDRGPGDRLPVSITRCLNSTAL